MTLVRWAQILRHPHRDPRLVAWAATPGGQAGVWLLATVLLAPHSSRVAALVCPLLAVVLAFPSRRNLALSAGAVVVLYQIVLERQGRYLGQLGADAYVVVSGATVLVGLLLYLCFLASASFHRLPPAVRHGPQIWLHLFLWTALAAAWFLPAGSTAPVQASVRLTIACLPLLVWRCGYLLMAGRRGTAAGSAFQDHFFYLCPVYGGTPVPYGKGYDYLGENDATTANARARAQLAGLKLLGLAWLWIATRALMNGAVYGDGENSLGLYRLGYLVSIAQNQRVPLAYAWLSLLAELVSRTLSLAIPGHFIIGALRLFGFNVLRNTCKPLLSESLVDFWNRFYYYFKELLVEFFFFPAYLTWFKRWPRLRLLAATVAAAFFGNVYYHVLLDLPALARAGAGGAWSLMSSRVFYSILLATGLFVSLMRQQRIRGRARAPDTRDRGAQLRRIAGVWLFYAIIHIWNVTPIDLTFEQRTRFFFSLFGYGW